MAEKNIIYHGSNAIVQRDYVEDYMAGNISKTAFWELVKFKYPTHQVAFCTEAALETLRYEGSERL